jgi:FixJ family two-component response regulator
MVVIVDDEPDIRELVSDILSDEGYEAIKYDCGNPFLKDVIGGRFDKIDRCLFLLDIWMPDIDGISILKELHKKGLTKNIPVVVMSGHGTIQTAMEAARFGAVDFFYKPLELKQILLGIEQSFALIEETKENRTAEYRRKSKSSASPARIKKRLRASTFDGALSAIVGGFCHDLGNHIQGAYLALEGRNADVDAARRCIRNTEHAVKELHEMVRSYYMPHDEFLTYVRLGDLGRHLRNVAKPLLVGSEVGLSVRTSLKNTRDALIPSVLLSSLVVPLVNNAREAIDSGQSDVQKKINLRVNDVIPDKDICIAVTDSGPGWQVDLDALDQSVRAGQRFSTKGEGRGAGLTNVFRIVGRLGGSLKLRKNERNSGAKVELILPKEVLDFE